MSTRDPGNRPWRTRRGAWVIFGVVWTVAVIAAVYSGYRLGQPGAVVTGENLTTGEAGPVMVGVVGYLVGFAAMFISVFTGRHRDQRVNPAWDVVRFFGTTTGGSGLGALLAVWTGRAGDAVVPVALPSAVIGVLLFVTPELIGWYLTSRDAHRDHVKWHGAGAPGTVTHTWTFVEDEVIVRYRATITFTDRDGTQRWFKRLAPASVGTVREGRKVMVWFDPDNPGRRRSISVGWDNAAARRR